jgi:hypothetical protein
MKRDISTSLKRKKTLTAGILAWFILVNVNAAPEKGAELNVRKNSVHYRFAYTVSLTSVGVNVASGLITNTTTEMEYSFTSTNGTNGTWYTASSGNTTVSFGTGGFSVWVRNASVPTTYRKVTTIATQASAPSISINYTNETTSSVVAATVEYSLSADMSSTTSGTGVVVSLTPGTTYYFRTKATVSAVASAIKTLAVPARPATPDYTIDYTNETTNEIIASTDEYSSSSDMTYSSVGNNTKKNIYPGQTLYFRTKATSSSFKSLIQTLAIPSRPDVPTYTIDYENETTTQVVPATDEYSTSSSMTGKTSGNGVAIALTAGQKYYFRTKAASTSFKSSIQELSVPQRPSAPTYTVNFTNETTAQSIATSDEYSTSSDMKNTVSGTGSVVTVAPGQSYYFRTKYTASSLRSTVSTLVAPARPATPTYTIDFKNETTKEIVAATDEFSATADMSNASSGVNQKIAITAGQNIYFRKKATGSSFTSDIQTLEVTARQAAPNYSIDYENETTHEAIASTDQYSTSSSLSNPSDGINKKISIYPGQNLYFYTPATSSSFKSPVQALVVPARPAIPSYSIDFIHETTAQSVSTSDKYSYAADMSNAIAGTGTKLALEPEQTIYFMTSASASSFKSEVQTLETPVQSAAPSFSINYKEETTYETMAATYEYSTSGEMVDPTTGTGEKITIIPGENIYIRAKATSTSFSSETQLLEIPSRPIMSGLSIDYVNEKTAQLVDTNIEYSYSEDMSGSTAGTGTSITVAPGTNVYFRAQATDTCFRSSVYTLNVAQRPDAPNTPVIDLTQRALNWDLSSLYSDITDYEYSYDEENIWYTCASKPVQLKKASSSTSVIKLRVKASNDTGNEHFNSQSVVVDNPLVDPEGSNIVIRLYPNPVVDVLVMDADPTLSSRPFIRIMDSYGHTVSTGELIESHKEIDLSTLSGGVYTVIITDGTNVFQQKILKR